MTKKKLLMLIPLVIFLLLVSFFIKDIIEIWPAIFNGNEVASEKLLESFGWKGVFYLVFIQAIQMLLVFVPSEFIQVVAGATYGLFYGVLICWVGLILGATIIYLLVNVFKFKTDDLNSKEETSTIIKTLKKSKTSIFKITLILFFLPAIPYGVICYFASGTNMNYFKYILACLIGVLPSVIIDSLLGKATIVLIGKFLWPILIGFVLFMILFLWLVKKYSTRRLNKILYGTPKPTIDEILAKREIYPSNNNHKFIKKIVCNFFKKKNNVTFDDNIKDFTPPYIILSAHLSNPDFVYCSMALQNDYLPTIIANRYFFNFPILYKIGEKNGVIPKKLFTNDIKCIKQIIKVTKNGDGCIMMPEGRLSIDGTNLEMPGGLGKLLKKINVPILGVIPHGAYFTGAKWMKKAHKGKIEVETKVILNQNEIQELTEEQIEQKCKDALKYDEFEWIKKSDAHYKCSKFANGIEGILYHCPKCDHEFEIVGRKNKIICNHCHHETIIDSQFNFTNPPKKNIKNIKDWYNYQVELEQKNILSPDFELSCEVEAKTYHKYGKGLAKIGEGKCTLKNNTFSFCCTTNPNESVSSQNVMFLFGCEEDFETYINDKFYYFVPKENKKQCVKWAICSEIIKNLNKDSTNNG